MGLYTPFEIERFKSLRLADGVSPSKVNMDLRSVKAFFQVAVKWGIIRHNPFVGVKQLRIPQMRPVFLSKDEFSKVTAAIPHEWFRELVTFAVMTMMRVGEIVNLSMGYSHLVTDELHAAVNTILPDIDRADIDRDSS
jgi:integrase